MTETDYKNLESSTLSGKARIIKGFLLSSAATKVAIGDTLSENEYKEIVRDGFDLIKAVPESIGIIILPNGKKFSLDQADEERKISWTFEDLEKYAETLQQGEVFTRPRLKQF